MVTSSPSSSASDATGNIARQVNAMLAISNFKSFISLLPLMLTGRPMARSSLTYGYANSKRSIAIFMFEPGQ